MSSQDRNSGAWVASDGADSFSDLAGTDADLLAQIGHAPPVELDDAAGPPPVLLPGTTIGETFEIVERLGAGGMAVVYLARDRQLGRPVAIKLQRRPSDAQGLSRALREAMAMARLSHPNVLTVHEIGELGPRMYIVTEHIDGWNARAWVASQRPGRAAIIDLYLRAGEGLAAAHAVGIVHRDFKPDNVLVGRDGRVRVADFGLARVEHEQAVEVAETRETSLLTGRVTADGAIAGTLAYMPPEQRAGRPVDARGDQYAFCVALHEALTGELPGRGPTRLPAWLDRALRRGREPEPGKRYPSMTALLAALRRDARAARDRRLWQGAAVLVAGVAVAGAAGLFERPPLCADAGAPLLGVWDEPRRAAVTAAFTTACSAAGTCPEGLVDRTLGLLDEYAETWTAARTAGCEATHVHGIQSAELLDRRMLCLDERLRALDALVTVFTTADASVASEAPRAAAGLRSLAACADPSHLMARLAPPDDPVLEAGVAATRQRLAQAEALARAGRPQAALAATEPLIAEAASLGYAPLSAELAVVRGELLWQTDPPASEANLLEAHFLALASDHDEVVARAAIGLVWTTGYVQSRPDAAALWSRHALAATERRGTDVQRRAEALSAVASMHAEQGRNSEALALQDQALASIAPAGTLWASLANNRAATLDALGRYAEASAAHEQVLAEERRIFGPISARVAATLANLGLVRMRQGLPDEAVQLQREALAVFDATRGPAHEARWSSLLNLGVALLAADRPAEAMRSIDEALAEATRVLGEDHPDIALCMSARASALQRLGRPADAIVPARAALELLGRSYGPDHAEVLVQQSLLGQALAAAGQRDEALVLLTRAIAGWDARGEADHPNLAEALVEQGDLLRRDGQGDAATVAFTRALAIAGRSEVSAELVARARAGLRSPG